MVNGQECTRRINYVCLYIIGGCLFMLGMGAITQLDWIQGIKNKPIIDVREFGAKGNGTTDDTTAINNAFAAGNGKPITVVFSRTSGCYKVTKSLQLQSNLQIDGNGQQICAGNFNGTIFKGYTWEPTHTNLMRVTIKNLRIIGVLTSDPFGADVIAGSVGVDLESCIQCSLHNIEVWNVETGYNIPKYGAAYNTLIDVTASGIKNCMVIDANTVRVIGSRCNDQVNGILMDGNNDSILSSSVEKFTGYGVKLNNYWNTVSDTRFENEDTSDYTSSVGIWLGSNCAACQIRNPFWTFVANHVANDNVYPNLTTQLYGDTIWIGDGYESDITRPLTISVNDASYDKGLQLYNSNVGGYGPPIFLASYSTGLYSGIYVSGITAVGSLGQTCLLSTFNGGGHAASASVALTGTNTIANGTHLVIIYPGGAFTSAPTSATASSGTATCSGTAVITTVRAGKMDTARIYSTIDYYGGGELHLQTSGPDNNLHDSLVVNRNQTMRTDTTESNNAKFEFTNLAGSTAFGSIDARSTSSGTTVMMGSNVNLWSDGTTARYNVDRPAANIRANEDGSVTIQTVSSGADPVITRITIDKDGVITIPSTSPFIMTSLPVYADNAAAVTGTLAVGRVYRTSTGQMMVVY